MDLAAIIGSRNFLGATYAMGLRGRIHQEGDKIEVAFQPLPMACIMASVKVVHDEPDEVPLKEEASQEPHPTFGPHPNNQAADFDLKKHTSSSLQAQSKRHSFRYRKLGQIYQSDSW